MLHWEATSSELRATSPVDDRLRRQEVGLPERRLPRGKAVLEVLTQGDGDVGLHLPPRPLDTLVPPGAAGVGTVRRGAVLEPLEELDAAGDGVTPQDLLDDEKSLSTGANLLPPLGDHPPVQRGGTHGALGHDGPPPAVDLQVPLAGDAERLAAEDRALPSGRHRTPASGWRCGAPSAGSRSSRPAGGGCRGGRGRRGSSP